jgi:hypothetical protein
LDQSLAPADPPRCIGIWRPEIATYKVFGFGHRWTPGIWTLGTRAAWGTRVQHVRHLVIHLLFLAHVTRRGAVLARRTCCHSSLFSLHPPLRTINNLASLRDPRRPSSPPARPRHG